MPGTYILDEQVEASVQAKLATLDAAIARGIAESAADDVEELDHVCEALTAELTALPDRGL